MRALPTDLRPFETADLRFHLAVVAGELVHRMGGGAVAEIMGCVASELVLPRKVVVVAILHAVCKEHEIGLRDLLGPSKFRHLVDARWDAAARLRALRKPNGGQRFTQAQIGEFLGGRDPTTIINGLKRWKARQGQ